MMTQTIAQQFIHLVTLVNPFTGEEASFHVDTPSPDFAVVWREIAYQRAQRKLWGYELHESLPVTLPF